MIIEVVEKLLICDTNYKSKIKQQIHNHNSRCLRNDHVSQLATKFTIYSFEIQWKINKWTFSDFSRQNKKILFFTKFYPVQKRGGGVILFTPLQRGRGTGIPITPSSPWNVWRGCGSHRVTPFLIFYYFISLTFTVQFFLFFYAL